ncbi:MAG TPA: tripartite tricarboxylate transporter substrate-binding protein [Rhizobacter sp.]|nr:tripartite tricarboxylate transporter substrate-binding protein [Rhizobacter sp.]
MPFVLSPYRVLASLLAGMVLSVLWVNKSIAAYPDRPITIVVPFSPGGPTDKTARDLAQTLQKILGAPAIVVDNTAGAGGTIGAVRVIKSPPDGYTLLLAHIGMSTSYALYPKLTYSMLDDFEYLGVISEVPMVLVGRPNLKASNVAELIHLIGASNGTTTVGHAGIGSASHLCSLLLQSHLKQTMTGISYKGVAPAMNDVVAGHVDLLCDQSITAGPQVEAGRLKAFAVTTTGRLAKPSLSNIPTLDESGMKGFNFSVWQAVYAPRGTPKAILETLNNALRAALKDPEFAKRQLADGVRIVTDTRLTPAGHKELMRTEMAKWTAIIKAAGVYAE